MTTSLYLITAVVSGFYTSLWGAFKDSPYEGFKPKTFPRSVYFNVVIFLALMTLPGLRDWTRNASYIQIFFAVMGLERFITEIYKGFFRNEDQTKYFIPSRFTFFGKSVTDRVLLLIIGIVCIILTFSALFLPMQIESLLGFFLCAFAGGVFVSLGGAYKDAPFEGFDTIKFFRSAMVLSVTTPFFYYLGPVPLGILIFMNGGLERFLVEYYKTFIQRNMSGKFRPDLKRDQKMIDTREIFHYGALVIIALVIIVYIYELKTL